MKTSDEEIGVVNDGNLMAAQRGLGEAGLKVSSANFSDWLC